MRKLMLSITMLIAFLTISAQKNKLQELQEQLHNHPQQDTFRVNRLNKIAVQRELSTGGRDAAADEALLLWRQLNYNEGEAHALMAQANTKDVAQVINETTL